MIYFKTHALNSVPLSRSLFSFVQESTPPARPVPWTPAVVMPNDSQFLSLLCIWFFCAVGT